MKPATGYTIELTDTLNSSSELLTLSPSPLARHDRIGMTTLTRRHLRHVRSV
jgi:hypothetical protein